MASEKKIPKLKILMGEMDVTGSVSDKELKAMKEALTGAGASGGGMKKAMEAMKKTVKGAISDKEMSAMKQAAKPQKKRNGGGMMMRAKGKANGGAMMMKAKGKAAGGAMNGMMMRAKGKAAGGARKNKAKSSPVRAPSSKNSGLYGR
jgi:hypothetical protein